MKTKASEHHSQTRTRHRPLEIPCLPHRSAQPSHSVSSAKSARRSCAVAFVNLVTNLLPPSIFEFVGQSSRHCDERRELPALALSLLQDQPQPLLGQRTESRLLFSRNALSTLEKVVANFNGRFHDM